jgi:hypothetical protein
MDASRPSEPASSGPPFVTLSRATEFQDQARGFADALSNLLNRTVTTGIRIKSVLRDDGEVGWVGYRSPRPTSPPDL